MSDEVGSVPTPRMSKAQAIGLNHFEVGEADRVLTLLTPHDGKLKAIAKGVRRPGSRIGGSVEPFAELHLVLVRGRTFDVITQASVGEARLAPPHPPGTPAPPRALRGAAPLHAPRAGAGRPLPRVAGRGPRRTLKRAIRGLAAALATAMMTRV